MILDRNNIQVHNITLKITNKMKQVVIPVIENYQIGMQSTYDGYREHRAGPRSEANGLDGKWGEIGASLIFMKYFNLPYCNPDFEIHSNKKKNWDDLKYDGIDVSVKTSSDFTVRFVKEDSWVLEGIDRVFQNPDRYSSTLLSLMHVDNSGNHPNSITLVATGPFSKFQPLLRAMKKNEGPYARKNAIYFSDITKTVV